MLSGSTKNSLGQLDILCYSLSLPISRKDPSFFAEISVLSVSATPGPEGLVILTREAAVVPGPD